MHNFVIAGAVIGMATFAVKLFTKAKKVESDLSRDDIHRIGIQTLCEHEFKHQVFFDGSGADVCHKCGAIKNQHYESH